MMNEPEISIEDLQPDPAMFHLRLAHADFSLRPVSAIDEIWIKKNYPDIEARFKDMDIEAVARTAFQLMTDESRTMLSRQTIEVIDENGDAHAEVRGGVTLLLSFISGHGDILAIMQAIMVARFGKKVLAEIEKKRSLIPSPMTTPPLTENPLIEAIPPIPPTGLISSIPSAPNMDGVPSTFSTDPYLKSATG